MTDVALHPDVADYLDGYPDENRSKNKLRDAADNPAHYLKRLSNRDKYRLRIVDYRAHLYTLANDVHFDLRFAKSSSSPF